MSAAQPPQHSRPADEAPLSRERQRAFEAFIGYLTAQRAHFTGQVMLDELMRLRGASLQIYDAPQFIFAYARSQGYHIPSYPYDPTSELRAFLADWEVADIPAWYARIGVDAGSYAVLAQRRLLVARDDAFRRKAFLMSIPERTTDDECASLVERVVAFLSGGRTDDPTIF